MADPQDKDQQKSDTVPSTATAPVEIKATAPVETKATAPVETKATAPVETKATAPVETKATDTTAVPTQLATPVSESTARPTQAEQKPVTQKASKSAAAARIMEQASKAKTDAQKAAADGLAAGPQRRPAPESRDKAKPAVVMPGVSAGPVAATPEPPKPLEITLRGELAQVSEALQKKMVSEENLLEAFFLQAKLEKDKQSKPLLEILRERNFISGESGATLAGITEFKLVLASPPRTNPFDLALGHKLMEEKLVSREETQRVLRIQASLNKLGIARSLESLLLQSRVIAPEILKPFMEQMKQQAQEKKQESETVTESEKAVRRREAIRSQDNQLLSVWTILGSLLAVFLGVVVVIAILAKITPPRDTSQTKVVVLPTPHQTPDQPNTTPPIKPIVRVKPQPRPPVADTPEQTIEAEKRLEILMTTRGLAKWGNYWISQEQNNELAKRWGVGDKPSDISFNLDSQQVIYHAQSDGVVLKLLGQLEIPALPRGLFLHLEMQLLPIFQDNRIYAEASFQSTGDHNFQGSFPLLPKSLAPGLYLIKLYLQPERQSEFLQDFLSLKERRVWTIPFTVGSRGTMEQYLNEQLKLHDELVKTFWANYQNLQQFAQKEPAKIRQEWPKWASQWQNSGETVRQKIETAHNRFFMPMLPAAQLCQIEFVRQLAAIYTAWDNWQRDFASAQTPDFYELYANFEMTYDRLRLVLKQEPEKLRTLWRQTKAIASEEEADGQ